MQEQIKNINNLEELQALYTATFGKNGTMTARLKEMKNLDNDARVALNLENTQLRDLFKTRQSEIENAVLMDGLKKQKLDVSLNPMPENRGTLHPLTQSLSEIAFIKQIDVPTVINPLDIRNVVIAIDLSVYIVGRLIQIV